MNNDKQNLRLKRGETNNKSIAINNETKTAGRLRGQSNTQHTNNNNNNNNNNTTRINN